MPKLSNIKPPQIKPVETTVSPAKLQKDGIAKFTGETHSYSFQRPHKKVLSRYSR